jgi:hypothetical protein
VSVAAIEHQAATQGDPFANWTPSEVGQRLVKSNFRWGFMAGILMIAAGLTGFGFWVYQQPKIAADAAQEELIALAQSLEPAIGTLIASDLSIAETDMSRQLVSIDADARTLFDVAGALPSSLSGQRSLAANIAGQALEGSRILSNAWAYRSAVVPILENPGFETDPALIALDDAAAAFGLWQTRFQAVATALPSGVMDQLGDEIFLISGSLDTIQTGYLDALRTDDSEGVALVLYELETKLGNAGALLATEFDESSEAASVQFEKAAKAISLLLS